MKEVKHGAVSVVLPASVSLDSRAGKMSKKEVSRLLKAPHGMELAEEHAALALETLGASFTAPIGVTPESLRKSGATESFDLERVIGDLLFLLLQLKQGKLLIDHARHLQLRKLKDEVRAQAKYNPQLLLVFAPLLAPFEKSAQTRKENQAKAKKAARESKAQQVDPIPVEKTELHLVKTPETAS
jgi:hypothetical protein